MIDEQDKAELVEAAGRVAAVDGRAASQEAMRGQTAAISRQGLQVRADACEGRGEVARERAANHVFDQAVTAADVGAGAVLRVG